MTLAYLQAAALDVRSASVDRRFASEWCVRATRLCIGPDCFRVKPEALLVVGRSRPRTRRADRCDIQFRDGKMPSRAMQRLVTR